MVLPLYEQPAAPMLNSLSGFALEQSARRRKYVGHLQYGNDLLVLRYSAIRLWLRHPYRQQWSVVHLFIQWYWVALSEHSVPHWSLCRWL